jgi:hypothetical protein
MAKINVYVPEPPQEYTTEGFRQINQALATIENQLNTSYQQDLKNEQDSFNYFMSMTIRYKSETFDLTTTNVTTILTCPSVMQLLLLKSLQAYLTELHPIV